MGDSWVLIYPNLVSIFLTCQSPNCETSLRGTSLQNIITKRSTSPAYCSPSDCPVEMFGVEVACLWTRCNTPKRIEVTFRTPTHLTLLQTSLTFPTRLQLQTGYLHPLINVLSVSQSSPNPVLLPGNAITFVPGYANYLIHWLPPT